MNITLAKNILKQLVERGVFSFCICPGGRSAPFIELLSQSKGLSLFYFFEERSAGFFALGRSQRDKNPVAVITTSGTAVAELLPCVIEADYSKVPLVLMTCDRPLKFGQKGCPQTLKKASSLFKDYCKLSQNISRLQDFNLENWNLSSSLHLNICFEEPLIDEKVDSLDFSKKKTKKIKLLKPFRNFQKRSTQELNKFFKCSKKPLILIGELKDYEVPMVKNILKSYNNPIYLEALSQLQGVFPSLLSGEKILSYALKNRHIDSVLRIGGVPRSRFWRDLEKDYLPVLNLSSAPYYEGLSRFTYNHHLLEQDEQILKDRLFNLKDFGKDLKTFDQIQSKKYQKILKQYPKSEQAWFLTLKKSLKPHSKVFLGNSSPIRFWDQIVFCQKKSLKIQGQNGVNGIDGLLSRFLGQCEEKNPNVAFLGDLSLLYDMSGFWKSKSYPPWTVFVINNFGGQIFSRLYKNSDFLNSHNISFEALAKMWSISYKLYKDPFLLKKNQAYTLIEIQPSNLETKKTWKEYLNLWNA
ncbi:MAG: 2-succinyl-5-enolpyruvyl-6-hydroxy-3-cyclohexene-1-carboxylic-acid synthase [Bdellovibrionales bacterium]|nr:2-succinyl-5-enolpyruvyl-6-hydroxy-3-cyclohexene-1-carboxylic-acid synthase [Bdellovibrionales bacterium]